MVEIAFNHLAFDPTPKKIGPEEFAERGRILRETAGASQFARERTERIVDQVADRLGNVLVFPPAALIVEWMHPVAVVHDEPEGIRFQPAEVGDDGDDDVLDAFIVQRASQMMVINDVVTLFRSEDDRDHVLAEEFRALFPIRLLFAPTLALGHDLAHANRDLGWAQACDMNWMENGLTNSSHVWLPMASAPRFATYHWLQSAPISRARKDHGSKP